MVSFVHVFTGTDPTAFEDFTTLVAGIGLLGMRRDLQQLVRFLRIERIQIKQTVDQRRIFKQIAAGFAPLKGQRSRYISLLLLH
jgi:hypothetical protein